MKKLIAILLFSVALAAQDKAPAFAPDKLDADESSRLDELIAVAKAAQADVDAMERMTQPAGQATVAEIVIRYKDRLQLAATKAQAVETFVKQAMGRRGYDEKSGARFDLAAKRFIHPETKANGK